jgi:hypothetical protein
MLLLVLSIWSNFLIGPASDLFLPILVAMSCLVLYFLIDQYYGRVYGKVKRSISLIEMFWQAACAVLALAAFIFDMQNTFVISLLGLVFALTFAFTGFWYWRPVKLMLTFNLALAVLLTLLSLLPLIGVYEWWNYLGLKHSLLAFTFLFGLLGVVGGVIAHICFVRSLPAAAGVS